MAHIFYNIKSSIVDMKENPICKVTDNTKVETDVGSCDRWKLLYNMLKGSYTESNTAYGILKVIDMNLCLTSL